jgi:hypothetical protein
MSTSGGALGFLFQGTAPPSTTSTSSSSVPSWLSDYAQQLISASTAAASVPYQAFPGQQVAGFTTDQTNAQGTVEGLNGAYQPALNSATSLAASSANPQAISGALSTLPGAQTDINNSIAPTAAQINPYENDVIQNAETQASQYWQNTLQPSINNQFTQSGQFNSSANQLAQDQSANQLTSSLQGTANAALAQGYTNAQQANLAAGQATGALGQIQGGLGYEQGVLGEQGASTEGNLASTSQQLGLQGASALDTVGGEQQSLNQSNINSAMSNFNAQTAYPEQQLSYLQSMLSGTATPSTTPTSSTTTGVQPGVTYQPSPLSSAISTYGALNSLGNTASTTGG